MSSMSAMPLRVLALVAITIGTAPSQESRPALEAAFMPAVRDAIRAPLGGVLVIEVMSSGPRRGPHDPLFMHSVSIDIVIKSRKDDYGRYFQCTTLGEFTDRAERGKPFLKEGQKYIVAVKLRGFPLDIDEVHGALRYDASSIGIVPQIAAEVSEHAAYGSDLMLNGHLMGDVDVSGVRSARPDGSVDPTAFHLDEKAIVSAIRTGNAVCVGFNRGRRLDSNTSKWEIIEVLGGGVVESPSLIPYLAEDEELAAQAARVASPYAQRRLTTDSLHLIIVEVSRNRITRIVNRLPLIGKNDACVQRVREWALAAASSDSRASSQPRGRK